MSLNPVIEVLESIFGRYNFAFERIEYSLRIAGSLVVYAKEDTDGSVQYQPEQSYSKDSWTV